MDTLIELLKKLINPNSFNEEAFINSAKTDNVPLICNMFESPLKKEVVHTIKLVIKYSQLNSSWKSFSLKELCTYNNDLSLDISEKSVANAAFYLSSQKYDYRFLTKSSAEDYSVTTRFFEEFAEYFTRPLPSDFDLMGFTKLKNHLNKPTPGSTPDEREESGIAAGLTAMTFKKILLFSLFNGNKWQAISPTEMVSFAISEGFYRDDIASVERAFRLLARDGYLEQHVNNDATTYTLTEKSFELLVATVLRR